VSLPQRAQPPAPEMNPRRTRASREQASEAQRTRILYAMVRVASEHGAESASVARVVARAGVSRKTFYDLFEDRNDCLHAAFEEAVGRARERASAAYDAQASWVDRVRAGLCAVLMLIDDDLELARLCVEHALKSPTTLNGHADQLIRLIDEGRGATRASRKPPAFAAQGVLGGAAGLIYARLIERDPRSFREPLNPLMSIVVLPYLGQSAADRELTRSVPKRPFASPKPMRTHSPVLDFKMRLTYRTLRVLEIIADESGLSNMEVGERAGISDQGQTSKMLARLSHLGLTKNTGEGQPMGEPNAWSLTARGEELLLSVGSLR
jgi:AcrR family transcriptional regulator